MTQIHYDPNIKKFTFRPTHSWRGRENEKFLSITGDYKSEYKKRLICLLKEKGNIESGGFDMEPLEVLRDMIRDGGFDKIGGAPQITKVYKYSSTRPFAIYWPNKDSGKISLNGRPLLDYELSEYHVYDPDTFELIKHADIA